MTYTHLFQYNIPADNEFCGRTDKYINVIAEWNGSFFNDGSPVLSTTPIVHHFADLIAVKDWYLAKCDIDKIAQKHFSDMVKAERIKNARETLISEGQSNIPTLDRYEVDLLTQQTLS